jgi:hypothetical protein
MYTDTEQHAGSFQRTRWHVAAVVWVAGLVAVTAGWLGAAPASAQTSPGDGTVFVHSAKSGKLDGGRLTLQGVGRRVTWAHKSGRSGVMTVKRLHRRLFSAKTATATGILHVAGHRGGDELTYKLSRPRYNAARRTVSYKIKGLGDGRLPSRAAQAAGAPRRFGAASLSMVGALQGSVTVQQITYGCANNPGWTCWGVLYASGIQPNGGLFVNWTDSNGGTHRDDYSGFAVAEGGNVQNPPVYLQLPCTNDFNLGAMITSVEAKDAASGQSVPSQPISPPGGCSGA